jgi:glycosyltransferase involved in cell wall biosynthesis
MSDATISPRQLIDRSNQPESAEIKVSCILPTFNRGQVLCDTIKMLLGQTVAPFEIIVVDQSDQLIEESQNRLTDWQNKGVIQLLRQQEPNASKARNSGAMAASGDVLLFLDDDIRIQTDFVEAHGRNYLDPAVEAVAGQILDGNGDVVQDRPKICEKPELDWLYFPRNYGQRCKTTWMASGNFSVRRKTFFEVGGMDENFMKGAYREESDFAMRFIKKGFQFQFDPEASIYHLAVAGAPTGGSRQKNWARYGFHMYGFWYFVFGNATLATWPTHLVGGIRYFLINSFTIRHPWRIPLLAFQFMINCPIALLTRMRGPKLVGRVSDA